MFSVQWRDPKTIIVFFLSTEYLDRNIAFSDDSYIINPDGLRNTTSCPQSHRRNLQTQGKSTLQFQPIAKKEEIFLFFRLVHTHIVITELQGIIPYDSDYKIHDWWS
jgi:hypothetical protein